MSKKVARQPDHVAERDRRWDLLDASMREWDLNGLIFAANDYRGHKGSLRYVADYNLPHKAGNAVKFLDREPSLVLQGSLSTHRKPETGWVKDYVFAPTTAQGLVESLEGTGATRIGIVGLGQVMKVDEYQALVGAYPEIEFIDFSKQFELLRFRKSPYELQGAEESAYILDKCFERLLEIVRPGMTEREIASEMLRVAYSLGGEDPLFLSMHTDESSGVPRSSFGPPRDRILRPHDIHTFSFEVIGPRGYWTELSRMVAFASPSEDDQRMADAIGSAITEGAALLKPGSEPSQVQTRILDTLAKFSVSSSYWSGHSLGLDVLQEPWIGLDVVEDGDQSQEIPLEESAVITLHPMGEDLDAGTSGYMSDTFIVENGGGRKLSRFETQLFVTN